MPASLMTTVSLFQAHGEPPLPFLFCSHTHTHTHTIYSFWDQSTAGWRGLEGGRTAI